MNYATLNESDLVQINENIIQKNAYLTQELTKSFAIRRKLEVSNAFFVHRYTLHRR